MTAPVTAAPSGAAPPRASTAAVVTALEGLWAAVRAQHPEVPEVVLVLGSGSSGKSLVWGHHWADRWQDQGGRKLPEILVSGEGLGRSAEEVLGTVLHEAAHALATARGVKDTSRNGQYHNRGFKKLAEELGISVEQQGKVGWSKTSTPAETIERYREPLRALRAAIFGVRLSEPRGGKASTGEQSEKNGIVVHCDPDYDGCGRKFRISRTAYEAGGIECVPCGLRFVEQQRD